MFLEESSMGWLKRNIRLGVLTSYSKSLGFAIRSRDPRSTVLWLNRVVDQIKSVMEESNDIYEVSVKVHAGIHFSGEIQGLNLTFDEFSGLANHLTPSALKPSNAPKLWPMLYREIAEKIGSAMGCDLLSMHRSLGLHPDLNS